MPRGIVLDNEGKQVRKSLLLGLVAVLGALAGEHVACADARRFAVFAGSNIGDRHEAILHHAEDDAVRVAQTLRTLGDFPPDQVLVLNGATASELRDAIIRLTMRVRDLQGAVLVLFYSGHADAESLHLAGTHFPLAELKALLVGSPAASRVLVVDACRSGSLIGMKGARPTQAFPVAALDEPSFSGAGKYFASDSYAGHASDAHQAFRSGQCHALT
jgi:hypothetical protein